MNTKNDDRLAPDGDAESAHLVRAVLDEIRRQEPQEAAVQRVVIRALQIHDTCSRSSSHSRRAGTQPRRRTLKRRTLILATAVALLVSLWLGVLHFSTDAPGAAAFAQTVAQIENAKSIAWKQTCYRYSSHGDGKGTWGRTEEEHAYKAPGLYRQVEMTGEEKNPIRYVRITDEVHKKEVTLLPKSRIACFKEVTFHTHDPDGPFASSLKELKQGNLQWIGRRETATGEVNVFRKSSDPGDRRWSVDLWIDPETKQLVGMQVPGADMYDPDNDPGRDDPVGEKWPYASPTCSVIHDIDFDAKLDDSLFSFEPPEGYTVQVKKRSSVTEQEMIDYIGILADLNGKTFPGRRYPNQLSLDGPGRDREKQIWEKPEKERTAAESKYTKARIHYVQANLNRMPLYHFITDNAVENSFRYFGKGVKLGDENAIVCWYRLKGAKTYRVVYGDLSVRDVAQEDLPLPVEP